MKMSRPYPARPKTDCAAKWSHHLMQTLFFCACRIKKPRQEGGGGCSLDVNRKERGLFLKESGLTEEGEADDWHECEEKGERHLLPFFMCRALGTRRSLTLGCGW